MNTNKDCLMRKKDIVKAIVEHYRIRNNIITAIKSALPTIKNNTIGNDGYCSFRFYNLKKGSYCLPKSLRNSKLPYEQLVQEVMKYVEKKKGECFDNYWELTPEEKRALMNNSDPANRYYIQKVKNLEDFYLSTLNQFIELLNILENELSIDNEQLFKLAVKTKDILDNMYKNCQVNYVHAILALLYANLEDSSTKKQILNTLKEL